MGLFDKIKSKFVSDDGTYTPPEASFATRPDTVYAPVSGVLIPLEEVNDEIISAGLIGNGYGILPTGNGVLYSPVNGRIGATTVTNHSIGIATHEGIEVLIHIGIGTALCFSYILFNRFFEEFAKSGSLPPGLAVWLPNIIYLGIALYLYRKAPK